MALPKQVLPIYNLKVPSTGKTVTFRQFTVREEKAMVQAQQSEDMDVITNAVSEIILACVPSIKNINELSLFDIEYIITKIRAKSVGETVELNMICDVDEDHERTPVSIDIDKLEVKFPKGHTNNIKLYDDVGVVMRYPSLKDIKKLQEVDGLETILSCIDHIYTSEEMFEAKDQTREELLSFLNSLTLPQIEKIESSFFRTMPTYTCELEYKCKECGHMHNKVIKGLANFFA